MSAVQVLLAVLLVTAPNALGPAVLGAPTHDAAGSVGHGSLTAAPLQSGGSLFEDVETGNSNWVVKIDTSMLTSMFAKGSVFRVVTGGSVNGERVVWFDIGIAYEGGAIFSNPMDNFVVRADMSMNFPSL